MRLEYQILCAFLLDLLIGDPHWFPHPVRLIGNFALKLETPLRRMIPDARKAGLIVVILVLAAAGSGIYAILWLASLIGPIARDITSIFILYTTFAARDLAQHAFHVLRELKRDNIESARQAVGMIVGRDTGRLEKPGIVRATVESVAENISDGVTAPIFYAAIGGPIAAILYKAVNTLDSSFGYKNERYLHFGRASARLDDAANYVPARLTGLLVAVAAGLSGLNPVRSLHILLRDCRKHPSPNSGMTEAAVAGALGIQIGGLNYYGGAPSNRPLIGDPLHPMDEKHITKSIILMLLTSLLALVSFVGTRTILTEIFR